MERMIVEYLANALWQLPLLAAGAWMLLRMVGMNAAAQHRLWLAVLALGLLLPLQGWQRVDVVPARPLARASSPGLYLGETFDSAAVTESAARAGGAVTRTGTASDWAGFGARVRSVRMNARLAAGITYLFLAAALFGLLRIALAWCAARRLVRDSRKFAWSGRMTQLVAESSRRLGVNLPEIRRSREIAGPVVVGAAAPVLLWPANFPEFGDDEVMAALCHEMAHIRRRDYLMNLICEGAGLPLKWHPAAHWVGSRIRSTREMACDAMAAEAMESEKIYAKSLLSLAQSMVLGAAGGTGSAAAGLFNGNALEERMMRLMQSKTMMSARARAVRGVAGAAAMAATIGLAAAFHLAPAMAQTTNLPAVQDAPIGGLVRGVQDGPVSPQVEVKPIAPDMKVMPEVKVAPNVKVQPLANLATVSPVVNVSPIVKVTPEVNVRPVVKVSPLEKMVKVSPVVKVTPEIRLLPKVIQTTPGTQTDPAQEGSGKGTGTGAGHGAGKSSGAGSRHRTYAIVNGQVRELTPEERRKVEAQLAEAQKRIAAVTVKFNSPEFRKQMEDAQRAATEAAAKMNSPEFQKQMADAQKQVAEATAKMNSPEFRKQMEEAQRAAMEANRKVQSGEFQKQMADAQKQIAEATARLNSPEFRKQMENAQRDAAEAEAQINSADFQKQMAEAQKQIADAMAHMNADREKDSDSKQH